MKFVFALTIMAVLFISGCVSQSQTPGQMLGICPEYTITTTERYVCPEIHEEFCFSTKLLVPDYVATEEEVRCMAEKRIGEMLTASSLGGVVVSGDISEIIIWMWHEREGYGSLPYTVGMVVWRGGVYNITSIY